MPSMKDEYGRKDRQRISEWVAIFMMINGMSEVPTSAWGWKYAGHSDVYRKRQGGRVTRLNASDGWVYSPNMKPCRNCGDEYPDTDDFWHKNPDGFNGRHSKCKACRLTERRSYGRNRRRGSRLPA